MRDEITPQIRVNPSEPSIPELSFGDCLPDLLQTIVVGPSNHKEQTAKAIRDMLMRKKLSSIEVRCSGIPYRGF